VSEGPFPERPSASPEDQAAELADRREPIILDPRTHEVLGTVSSFSWEQYYSGPLPTPQQLLEYNEVSAGLGDRIVTEWQTEGAHRRRLESTGLRGQLSAQRRGQIFALILALIIVGGGLALLFTDRSLEGLVAVLAPLATLAGVFIYNSSSGRERESHDGEHVPEADHEQLTRASGRREQR